MIKSIDQPISHYRATVFPGFITAAILLILDISSRCSSSSRSHSLVSRIEDKARVSDIKENRGEDDHTAGKRSQPSNLSGGTRQLSRTYTLSNPINAPSS
jgi:hypothetical protein